MQAVAPVHAAGGGEWRLPSRDRVPTYFAQREKVGSTKVGSADAMM
jgi:hypothetical protein